MEMAQNHGKNKIRTKNKTKTKLWMGPFLSDTSAKMGKRTSSSPLNCPALNGVIQGNPKTVNIKNGYRRKRNKKRIRTH